ncbi:copper resistance protein CopC [Pseudolysinimonas sp.]|jgi:methionine-rich copper-binding protein CopC|uniref:copper resistance protein CopC n=1 Tax=Pseudolysinimonas sp. TaxID=2680009 RepID=UPI003784E74E
MSRAWRAALTGAAAAALVLAVAAPASAHNYVVSSNPAQGEVVTALPEAWELVTNETLLYVGNDAVFGLWTRDAAGLFYGDGCVDVSGPGMTAVPAIGAPGDYTLAYSFISADGHPLTGEIPFEWAPAEPSTEVAVGSATAPQCGEAAPSDAPEAGDPEPESAAPAGDSTVWWIVGAFGAVAVATVAALLIGRRTGARRPRDPAE